MLTPSKTCVMCSAPLAFGRTGNLCGNPQCAFEYARLRPDQLCTICCRPLTMAQLPKGVCGSDECRWAVFTSDTQKKAERESLRRRTVKEAGVQHRESAAASLGIANPKSYPLALIPKYSATATQLPEERRENFRRLIIQLIDRAINDPLIPYPLVKSPPIDPPPALHAVLSQACGQCAGYCCRTAGDHAHLSADRIRRFLDDHPEMQPSEVLEAYMSHVGDETLENSCIFQQANRCSLPREMRADVCNEHFCVGLKDFMQDAAGDSPPKGFFVCATGDEIESVAFIDEHGTRVA